MRLWYQSLTRPDAWPAYNAALRALLDRVRHPDTEIEVHGILERGGIGDQYGYLEFIETNEVLANVERATREGFDAFLIGNIGDPGLRLAREITPIPVLGLCETSVHLACQMGANFSLVTGNEKHAPRLIDNIGRYGLSGRLAAVRRMQVMRLTDLDQAFTDAATRATLIEEFMTAARRNAADGAEVVIPAIGVLMTLLGGERIASVDATVPILNGVVAIVKQAEAIVGMRAAMDGVWTSRRALYAMPPREQIDELRQAYGEQIYPTLAPPDDGGRR